MESTRYLVVEAVAVEMRCVNVDLVAHAHQIPADPISNVHSQPVEIAEHLSVDGYKEGNSKTDKTRFCVLLFSKLE